MIIRRHSENYNFIGDTITGTTYRWGNRLDDNPLFAPWPELADISISNHCTKNCDFCYRESKPDRSFISIEDYDFIMKSLSHPNWGNVFQVALGGGEPFEHPDFFNIISLTKEYNVVPNVTTNGSHLNEKNVSLLQNTIGAIAVSVNSLEMLNTTGIRLLVESGIKTNLHFILSNKTIQQANEILDGKFNDTLKGINGIIFLTYKPLGRASHENCLNLNSDLKRFIEHIDNNKCSIDIGFDACFVPILLHLTKTNPCFIDACECAYFSVYIDEKLNVKPCSFAINDSTYFNLKENSFLEIWDNKFSNYRKEYYNDCKRDCKNKIYCRGACPYYDMINFCFDNYKSEALVL